MIRRLLAAAPGHLHPGGSLVMQLGRGQEAVVRRLAATAGLAHIDIAADLAGIPRMLAARRTVRAEE